MYGVSCCTEEFPAFFDNYFIAEINAFIADEYRGASDEIQNLVLAFSTERTVERGVLSGLGKGIGQ
jgi:hypothetical protein